MGSVPESGIRCRTLGDIYQIAITNSQTRIEQSVQTAQLGKHASQQMTIIINRVNTYLCSVAKLGKRKQFIFLKSQ